MLCRTIVLCIFALVLVKCVEMDTTNIIFTINNKLEGTKNTILCDHLNEKITENKYTALEGGTIKFTVAFRPHINSFRCTDYRDSKKVFLQNPHDYRKNATVKVTKEMGSLWKCTILTNKNIGIYPIVTLDNPKRDNYSVAYCYMQVHVRRIISPQIILLNNMVLEPVRTDLSEKDVDYTVDYEYADGDLVNVTCTKFESAGGSFTMEYYYADQLSNKFNSTSITSDVGIGVRAKLHSGYNNTHMICLLKEYYDESRVKITFLMRTEFERIVSLQINGMRLRPKPMISNRYFVEYRYETNQPVYVVCHAERPGVKLVIGDTDISKVNSYRKNANTSTNIVEISFIENSKLLLKCAADYIHDNRCAEITQIDFIPLYGLIDLVPLHIDLPPNGTVMELYGNNKRRVIYYEFEEGEKLTLNCYAFWQEGGPAIYVMFSDSDTINSINITQSLELSSQHEDLVITCYLMEVTGTKGEKDRIIREITVIFRKKVLTTTTTTTTTTTLAPEVLAVSPTSNGTFVEEKVDGGNLLLIAVGAATVIVVIGVAIIICKLRKRSHPQFQGGPYENNYENFQNQSEASIPAHPVQWESNYAVPVDQRQENETYSVPVKPETAMYATPIPKSERKNKKKIEPTYASLDLKPSVSGRNVFKNTNDPNYSEVCNKLEARYGKVLPKSKRNVNKDCGYVNVGNESPYANTNNDAEPMYCEPNAALKSQRGQYVNVNNAHYANRPAQEYVEPTYCEPHKRK